MKHQNVIKKKLNLTTSLVLFVFAVMISALMLTIFIMMVFHHIGLLSLSNTDSTNIRGDKLYGFLFALIGFCIFLGITITIFFSKKALGPIRKVIDATHKIAEGDFSPHLDIKGVGELEELSQSFNKMIHDLSSLEMLRSDFVNNFSHEFKTPIVSIRGFAKLLKNSNLSEEEKQEYLDIIIAESERLAELSTNVLNLSKYEYVEIISDKSLFRLDEQIRRSIIMTEPKWSVKEIFVNVELDKVIFNGNDDLTQQIWINLLDNAVKFSYQGGLISVSLLNSTGGIRFSIQDNGAGMDEQTKAHIFDKFYQGDTSHSKAGNGLGLAIVKRIVELFGGTIEVQSELGKGSIFTILLPNERV
ncbi:HAMP domain-containing histidine kinase [Clostridium estertheticum]|uniref:HAMP domain-containing sensor histidine kinase n=1 Tax=Clostridium estertheticum TaxID=238834 RepID=UPI001CCBE088|nr:HAMP domain-containing sensor histidine kinase [Clostridium estertheticum]MBZ9607391.1 HAMP domain-containing histidine kinase [Clostridium estertheticum]MBZ9609413.1 HAMP domain-containing histidine kinase [Clostridium estertheticum]